MSKEISFLEDNGQYPHGEVTISLEEYRDLGDTNSRSSILRGYLIRELKKHIDEEKKYGVKDFNKLMSLNVNAYDIMNIMGFYATYRGFEVQEEELIKSQEVKNE